MMKWPRFLARRTAEAAAELPYSISLFEMPLPPLQDEADDNALPLGCAWYDSSMDLQRGLDVIEMLPGASLPLGWWLAWEAPAQAAGPAGRRPSGAA